MSIPLPRTPSPPPADLSVVTLREGPPTRGELAKFYPAKYTWKQLKDFIKSGDLGLLKRDPALQERYKVWAATIKQDHGSITKYLVNVRLGWGPCDETNTPPTTTASPWSSVPSLELSRATPERFMQSEVSEPPYFTSEPSADIVKIIFNDWPYSVPLEISHYLIWSRLPIVHTALVHPSVADQVNRDGLWGFVGVDPSPSDNPVEGGDSTYYDVAPGTSPTARAHILEAAAHTRRFVLQHWPEDQWEVAWFVNPPRLQSVKDISHIHIFARKK